MALIVEKFGGSSVANIDRINAVADTVIRTRSAGNQVVVVLSAMEGETNRLLDLAAQIDASGSRREVDVLLATGEQVTIALLCLSLHSKGCDAISFTGSQVKILTDDVHGKARVQHVDRERITEQLESGRVVVVAGFQGIDDTGAITTLGRGGSDTTAVALAAALEAYECRIYSDVDGVFTADPRIVPNAKMLDEVTWEEMLELASLGAKVLQLRAVEFAVKYQVPLRVLSSFHSVRGTLITFEEKSMEQPIISGIAYNINEAKITIREVPDRPGIASKVFGSLSDENINVDMIIQNISANNNTDLTFTVERSDFDKSMQVVADVVQQIGAKDFVGASNIAKVSVVGIGMRSHTGIATTMFRTLANEGINIQMISTSEIKISVIVDDKYVELGVRALHKAFGLDAEDEPVEEREP